MSQGQGHALGYAPVSLQEINTTRGHGLCDFKLGTGLDRHRHPLIEV